MRVAALLCSVLGVAACAPAPSRAVPIIGPDGSRMLHVSCAENEARCYQLAGEQCPSGYDLARTAGGGGQSYLVRCRVPASWQAGPSWGPPTSTALPRPSPYQRSTSPVLAPSPYGSPPMPSPYPPLGSSPTAPSDIKESLDVGY